MEVGMYCYAHFAPFLVYLGINGPGGIGESFVHSYGGALHDFPMHIYSYIFRVQCF